MILGSLLGFEVYSLVEAYKAFWVRWACPGGLRGSHGALGFWVPGLKALVFNAFLVSGLRCLGPCSQI